MDFNLSSTFKRCRNFFAYDILRLGNETGSSEPPAIKKHGKIRKSKLYSGLVNRDLDKLPPACSWIVQSLRSQMLICV